ncbi:uncharacterized protein LOC125045465 [Penaeus chinensis]|uniref:uncharacterized protein LOC125045465 n=1 Tax=Penaeus chinensis TaxID=139456 RepID=UPI001FB69F21|nr:uncharacterized protein LOC125045465 [Penaeus chinensis]
MKSTLMRRHQMYDWNCVGILLELAFIVCAMVEPGLPPPRLPKPFNEKNLHFSKLYKCINDVGQKVLIEVLRAICDKEDFEKGIITVKDYCFVRLKWSNTKVKQSISKIDLPQMDNDMRKYDFNFGFCHKIINTILIHVCSQMDEKHQKQLERLKVQRNEICHQNIYNTSWNLEDRVNELRQIYKDIYEGFGKVLSQDFSKSISGINDILTTILNTQVRQDDLKTYMEIIEECRNSKISQMLDAGQKEQKSYYENLQLLNPCVWINEADYKKIKVGKMQKFCIQNLFTPLQLNLEGNVAIIDIKDLLTISAKSSGSENAPTALILMGLPGSGKTALLHYLIHVWCKQGDEINQIGNFDLVFFIETRTVSKKNLVEFLQTHKMFEKTCKIFDPDDIIIILKCLKLLFIIDGFDECNNEADQVVEDIFSRFNDQFIIMTTRPAYQEGVTFLANRHFVNCHFIEVKGFDHKQQKLYTEKVFRALETDENICKKLIGLFSSKLLKFEQSQIFQEHLKWPLNLAMLCCLWRADKKVFSRITSATKLYMEFFKHWESELARRLKLASDSGGNEFQEKLEILILFLGNKAWNMFLKEENTLDKESYAMIEHNCKEENINVQEFFSAFFMCQVDEDWNTEKDVYKFLNNNQVEYLAAGFLAVKIRQKETKLEDIQEEIGDIDNYQNFLGYLVGHLVLCSQHESDLLHSNMQCLLDLFDSAEVPKDNYNYWWNIFIESQHNEILGMKIASEKLPQDKWVLNAEQVVSGLRLLSYTPVVLKCLIIEISSDIDPHNIKYFKNLMKELRIKLETRHDKTHPISVELHFWHHYEEQHDKPSDEFIETLFPWGHLTNFTGSIGNPKNGKDVLSYCMKLKSIKVQVMTVAALKSLSRSLNGFYKSLKYICIVLALPDEIPLKEYPQLKKFNNLELCVKGIQDVNKGPWADVIKHMYGDKEMPNTDCRKVNRHLRTS